MNLKLKRPLAFFDLETTGLMIGKDRIVEISILKLHPGGAKESYTKRVNPLIPISAESTAIHGISDDDVKDEKSLKELGPEIIEFMNDCDLAGYNSNRFDVPMLVEELLLNGFDFDVSNRKLVDVQNVFHKMEQRTLKAAYKFYCSKSLENAHSAEADTTATYEILEAQLAKYTDDLEPEVDFLHDFSNMYKAVDLAGRIVLNNKDQAVFNFGKHKGKPVAEVFEQEPSYYKWMMDGSFPMQTKQVITAIRLKKFNN